MKRRDFFRVTTPIIAAPLLPGGLRMRGRVGANYLYERVAAAVPDDRVLVIIQLEGGNDGLNTVIPVEDPTYYARRPLLAVPKEDALPLAGYDELRMHPSMSGMARLFSEGSLAILNNVGYDRMNLSHFTGTEIWHTGSKSAKESYLQTGWMGRYLQGIYPDFPDLLPDHPPAIEISPSTSSLFTVVGASIGMSLTDPEEFYRMVRAGENPDDAVDVTTLAGREWEFVDRVSRQSATFAEGVRSAADKGGPGVPYPDDPFAAALEIIARLIAGGLATRVYKVSLGNFDTHGNQDPVHARLLEILSGGIDAFQRDLVERGVDHRVVGMTYSEFGRRVEDNGSGTDHGTAAPHFVFGSMVDGGKVIGGGPDLVNLDDFGNLRHTVDFACYYESVIAPLFGVPEDRLAAILPFDRCEGALHPLFHASGVAAERAVDVDRIDLR